MTRVMVGYQKKGVSTEVGWVRCYRLGTKRGMVAQVGRGFSTPSHAYGLPDGHSDRSAQ